MGTARAEEEIAALVAGDDWRGSLRTMEHILRTQGDHYEECLGREHVRLAEVTDPAAVPRISKVLAPVYLNKDNSPCKRAAIPKSRFIGSGRAEYESAFSRVQEMLVRLRALHAGVQAGREAGSLLRLFFRAERSYLDRKLREGLLDFDDLEIHTYHLLKGTVSRHPLLARPISSSWTSSRTPAISSGPSCPG
jgi:ATP-dependent exoDNAse (exonuclease V) beta subunit